MASENTPTVMLSYEICEIFKNTYFEEHLQKTASICFTSKYYSVVEFGLDETRQIAFYSIKCSYIIYM